MYIYLLCLYNIIIYIIINILYFGDIMDLLKNIKDFFKKNEEVTNISFDINSDNKVREFMKHLNNNEDSSDFRPVDFGYSPLMFNTALNKGPYLPYMFYFSEMLVYNCDVLRTIIKAIVWETFRNGVYLKERFIVKCPKCEAEYNEPQNICEVCGNKKLKAPNKYERVKIDKWMKRVNYNNQTLINVLEDIDWNLNIFDNAYVVVRKRYIYNNEGRLIGAKPIELLSGDVKSIVLLMNQNGRLGYDENDNMLFVCPVHRDRLIQVSESDYNEKGYIKCPICGKESLQAFAEYGMVAGGLTGMSASASDNKYYLCRGEILHVKKFTPGIGYGFPMPSTIAVKVLVLMKMDSYVLAGYSLGRPPKGLLILKGNRDSIAKSWDYIEEMSRRNPWTIAPLVIEGYEKYSGKIAEWIDLSLKMDETMLVQYRDELRRSIGVCYGVMPMFQGDMSVGGGLANEGLQITITNRTIEHEHSIMNEILEWISKQYGFNNYSILMKPHEEKDLVAQLHRIDMRMKIAKELIGMGYNVQIMEGVDGIEFKLLEGDLDSEVLRKVKELAQVKGIRLGMDDEQLKDVILKVMENPQLVEDNAGASGQMMQGEGQLSGNEMMNINDSQNISEQVDEERNEEEQREKANRKRQWARILETIFGGNHLKRAKATNYEGDVLGKYPSDGRATESRKLKGHPDVDNIKE